MARLGRRRNRESVGAACVRRAGHHPHRQDANSGNNHHGSTAISGIWSKPTVDILVELSPASWSRAREAMEAAGYICMSSSAARMSFNKGYTPQGYAERVFHIHFHAPGDNDEILFRDYLNGHPAVAREYEELKRSLAPRYRHDRDGYTEAKRLFVQKVMALAKSGG